MNRAEYRQAALVRLADARALLRARRYDGAYYLAGYVVECALKACIARQFRVATIPEPKLVTEIYRRGHELSALARLAGLELAITAEARRDGQFGSFLGHGAAVDRGQPLRARAATGRGAEPVRQRGRT